MRWLNKLLGRQQSHEEWLEAHPGKHSNKSAPPGISPEEEKGMRDRMEAELAEQRAKREGSD
ncbi:MAG: hypothetical protein AMXMBFR80_14100 [Dehalococcoidia bacterium]|jgi:hypothetical protein|nr:hypothetical protein [Tepidiformaceae bacterium]